MELYCGVSTSAIPDAAITPDVYNLLREYPVKAVEIGYEHTGPALADRNLYDQLVEAGRQAFLPVFSLHAPYRPDRDLSSLEEDKRTTAVEHATRALQLACDMDIRYVVIHGSQDAIASGARQTRLSQARKSLAALAGIARRSDLRIALEFMPPEWLPAGITEAEAMVDDLDPAVIGFCLDTNHANLTGDLSDIVHRLGPRLWTIHLSDNDGLQQQHWMPFQGVIDWPIFLSALADIGYNGPLMYELNPHPDGLQQALEDITANFERLCGSINPCHSAGKDR